MNALIATVEAEEQLAPQARTSGADDAGLAFAEQLLRALKARVERGESPSGDYQHPNLGRLVTESWNLSSPLARDLVEVEQLYLRGQR